MASSNDRKAQVGSSKSKDTDGLIHSSSEAASWRVRSWARRRRRARCFCARNSTAPGSPTPTPPTNTQLATRLSDTLRNVVDTAQGKVQFSGEVSCEGLVLSYGWPPLVQQHLSLGSVCLIQCSRFACQQQA